MKTIFRTLAAVSIASALSVAWGFEDEYEEDFEDEISEESSVEEEAEETGDPELEAISLNKADDKHYSTLPYCRKLVGTAEVRRPGSVIWEPIEEGRFYALGTMYRTKGANTELIIKFGKEVDVEIKGVASFGTRAQPLAEKSRTIVLVSGKIMVKLPRNFPDGLFVVTAPGFKVINLKGNSSYEYEKVADGDGDLALIKCITGDLAVEGRNFRIPAMKPANEVKIRTTLDQLITRIFGMRGDCIVNLDQGRVRVKDYATGETNDEEKKLDWKLSPQTAVRIHRAVPALGSKMAVTVMTFDAVGDMKNRCAFTENMVEVNSGELGSTSKADREAIAKKAAESGDVSATDVDVEVEEDYEEDVPDEEAPASDEEDDSLDDEDFDF